MVIIKTDKLNRVIYKKLNDVERFIFKYYGDTNKLKIVIKLFNQTETADVFDKNGDLIFYNSDGFNNFDLSCIKIYNNTISIKLPIEIRDEYLNILKKLRKTKKT